MIRSKYARKKAHAILEMAGTNEPPVDVNKVAEMLGFMVVPFDFPDNTSAIMFVEGNVKSIGVNSGHAPARQRFSVAHELGHFLSGHEDFSGEQRVRVDGQFDFSDPQYRQEVEANEFAAELLMPDFMLKKDLSAMGLDVPTLANKYQVSQQAMWIQLTDLNLAADYSKT